MATFTDSKRRATRRGYIRRMSDGGYLAVERNVKSNRRVRVSFDTYLQAKSWMFSRGLWVEA